MGRKCKVKDCLSDSKRSEDVGVTFHKIPNHSDIRPKWLSLCKIPFENNSNKIIYVCSRHFRKHDFCQFKGTKYMLKQGVLPSIFPWTDLNEIKSKILLETTKSDASNSDKISDSEPICQTSTDTVGEIKTEFNIKTECDIKTECGIHTEFDIKTEPVELPTEENEQNPTEIKEESELKPNIKTLSDKSGIKMESGIPTNLKCLIGEFSQGMRVEATDFNGIWFPAKVLEVDQSENEVFIQFEKSANRSNEWIPMDSKRLRPLQSVNKKQVFAVGERVMAMWTNSMKFHATIQKVMDDGDSYKVLFDDGVKSVLKSSKISKSTSTVESIVPRPHPSPLFAPVESTKQERRDRKRKIIVSELFHKKRVKQDSAIQALPVAEKNTPSSVDKLGSEKTKKLTDTKTTGINANIQLNENVTNTDEWICHWVDGQPVGTPGVVDSRKSVIVTDHRLPVGWIKHLVCRSQGFSAGKWDTILVNPEGRKFRSRNEVKVYLEQEKSGYTLDQFDFSLHLKRARSLGMFKVSEKSTPLLSKEDTPSVVAKSANTFKSSSPKRDLKDIKSPEREDAETFTDDENCENTLKIICEDGGYKCPIEGCGKNFRRENLAQMHIKHYHPEFSKYIGSTPNVADLAYARTIGEPIEELVSKSRASQGIVDKKLESVPKTPTRVDSKLHNKSLQFSTPTLGILEKKSPVQLPKTIDKVIEENVDKFQQSTPKLPKRESEIIKLLNSETKIPKTQDAYKIESKLSKHELTLSSATEDNSNTNKFPLLASTLDTTKTESSKLLDLKNKEPIKSPDSIFKREDSRTSGGIKTLLPVVRVSSENQRKSNDQQLQSVDSENHIKLQTNSTPFFEKGIKTNRKRNTSEIDSNKRRKYTKHDYSYLSDPRDSDSRSPDYILKNKNSKKKSVDFTDVPSSSNVAPQQESSQHIVTETGEIIKIERMKQEEIVNCTCGFMEEDGLMIQCELCLCWQHAYCNNIEREDQVPEKYICYICRNPLRMRSSQKYVHDQDWLKKGVLPTANYHSVDKDALNENFERLRRSHELSGNLNDLRSVFHSLNVKIKIAQNKDHPKFYLWSKPWEKTSLSHNVKDLLENQQIKSEPKETKEKTGSSNQTYGNCSEGDISAHNDIELSLKNLLNCSTESLKRENDVTFDRNVEATDVKEINQTQQTAQDLLKILEGTDILKHSDSEEIVPHNQETNITKESSEYSKIDLNSLLVNTNIDSVSVNIDIKTERDESVSDLASAINPNELEAVLRSDLSEDKVLTPLDEHSKSAFYDTIKSENKNVSFATDATDVSIHSGVISSGEVSDGELMSQALAGELLSSPTAALNLNFTQSDIDNIEKSIRISEAPVPEAKIEPEVCRQNLIDNVRHYQTLVKERMDAIEKEITALEEQDPSPENDNNISETVTMMLRDLSQMQKLAALF